MNNIKTKQELVYEAVEVEKAAACQYLVGKLNLDDPSWELVHSLDKIFEAVLEADEIDDMRSNHDFKWGCWIVYNLISDLREIRSTIYELRRECLCDIITDKMLLCVDEQVSI